MSISFSSGGDRRCTGDIDLRGAMGCRSIILLLVVSGLRVDLLRFVSGLRDEFVWTASFRLLLLSLTLLSFPVLVPGSGATVGDDPFNAACAVARDIFQMRL